MSYTNSVQQVAVFFQHLFIWKFGVWTLKFCLGLLQVIIYIVYYYYFLYGPLQLRSGASKYS